MTVEELIHLIKIYPPNVEVRIHLHIKGQLHGHSLAIIGIDEVEDEDGVQYDEVNLVTPDLELP